MNAAAVLERLSAQGVQVTPRPNGNLWLEPASKIPADLLDAVRKNKPAILALLSRPRLAEGSPEWHGQEIARRVEETGYCLFWSELFGEMIAFCNTDADRKKVPAGIVTYSAEELLMLDLQDPTDETRRLVHLAKQHGGRVAGDRE